MDPRLQLGLGKLHLSDERQVLCLPDLDIQRISGLSIKDVQVLKNHIAKQIVGEHPRSALQLMTDTSLQPWKLPIGCPVVDEVLRGGVVSGLLTEITGESACGKTQLCLQLCISIQLNEANSGGAVYICTEDVFPSKRLQQLINACPRAKSGKALGDGIFIEHVADFETLDFCVENKLPALLARRLVRLVVIDSVAALFRCHYENNQMYERAKHLHKFASSLKKLSTQYNVPVVCVNQVSANFSETGTSTEDVIPALGLTWANQISCRIMLSRSSALRIQRVQHLVKQKIQDRQHNVVKEKGSEVQKTDVLPTYRVLKVAFSPNVPTVELDVYIDDCGIHGVAL